MVSTPEICQRVCMPPSTSPCQSVTWRVRTMATCVLSVAMATAVSAGQVEVAAPSRWWRSPTVQHDLRLTSEQVRQLDSIRARLDGAYRAAPADRATGSRTAARHRTGSRRCGSIATHRRGRTPAGPAQRASHPDVGGNAQGPDTCAANQAVLGATFIRPHHSLTRAAMHGRSAIQSSCPCFWPHSRRQHSGVPSVTNPSTRRNCVDEDSDGNLRWKVVARVTSDVRPSADEDPSAGRDLASQRSQPYCTAHPIRDLR